MLEITGYRVYGKLKFESGIHEVQRFPLVELTNKKTINSTATILAMPEVTEVEFPLPLQDLEIRHYNYGFRGHPRPREVDGCDLHHKPTGISILCYQEKINIRIKNAQSRLCGRNYTISNCANNKK